MLDRNEINLKATENPTPYFMLWFRDESRFYQESPAGIELLARAGGKIYGVYLFNSRLTVNCAELAPSYEMEFREAMPLVWPEEGQDEMESDLATANRGEHGNVRYFHCRGFQKDIQDAIDRGIESWDGSGEPPPIVLVEELPVAAWQGYLDDEGDYRAALNKAILDIHEDLNANARY